MLVTLVGWTNSLSLSVTRGISPAREKKSMASASCRERVQSERTQSDLIEQPDQVVHAVDRQ